MKVYNVNNDRKNRSARRFYAVYAAQDCTGRWLGAVPGPSGHLPSIDVWIQRSKVTTLPGLTPEARTPPGVQKTSGSCRSQT